MKSSSAMEDDGDVRPTDDLSCTDLRPPVAHEAIAWLVQQDISNMSLHKTVMVVIHCRG